MTARTRYDLHFNTVSGLFWTPWYETEIDRSEWASHTTCHDTVGERGTDNVFHLLRYGNKCGIINSERWLSGTCFAKNTNCPIERIPIRVDPEVYWDVNYGDFTVTQWNNWAVQIAGKSNPSVPHVAVPTAIGELKDVPDLVKGWGDTIITQAASANLWYKFGVKPMARDLSKLQAYVKAVNDLLDALLRLKRDGHLHRRVQLRKRIERSKDARQAINSWNQVTIYSIPEHYRTETVWGTCRWEPTGDFELPESDRDLERHLKRIVLGLNVKTLPSTLWELVPWSWLSDWFLNIQEFLNATNRSLELVPTGFCIMRHTTDYCLYPTWDVSTTHDPLTIEGKHEEWGECKRRVPVVYTGVPVAAVPSLSKGKWSILGSLAVLKGKVPNGSN